MFRANKKEKGSNVNPEDGLSLEKTFLKYRQTIQRMVSSILGSKHDVDDLVQETFLSAYKAAEKNKIEHPASYLFTTARRLAYKEKGRLSKKIALYIEDFSTETISSSACSAETTLETREELLRLQKAVDDLPDQCRKVMILRLFGELPQKEIASKLGIAVSTVEKHVAKGMAHCHNQMRNAGYERGKTPLKNGEKL